MTMGERRLTMSTEHYWRCSICGRTKRTSQMERTGKYPLCNNCNKRLRKGSEKRSMEVER